MSQIVILLFHLVQLVLQKSGRKSKIDFQKEIEETFKKFPSKMAGWVKVKYYS
jgi:hypothetical protein